MDSRPTGQTPHRPVRKKGIAVQAESIRQTHEQTRLAPATQAEKKLLSSAFHFESAKTHESGTFISVTATLIRHPVFKTEVVVIDSCAPFTLRGTGVPNSRSHAHCATIVGDWEQSSGESRLYVDLTSFPTSIVGIHDFF